MQNIFNILILSTVLSGCGCSHLHTYQITQKTNQQSKPPVDLSSFLRSNGFKIVDIENSIYSDIQLLDEDTQKLISIWEKWYKANGWIAEYSGGIRFVEYWDNETYSVEISSWGREPEAKVVADNLNRWFINNAPDIGVVYNKRAYIDLR